MAKKRSYSSAARAKMSERMKARINASDPVPCEHCGMEIRPIGMKQHMRGRKCAVLGTQRHYRKKGWKPVAIENAAILQYAKIPHEMAPTNHIPGSIGRAGKIIEGPYVPRWIGTLLENYTETMGGGSTGHTNRLLVLTGILRGSVADEKFHKAARTLAEIMAGDEDGLVEGALDLIKQGVQDDREET